MISIKANKNFESLADLFGSDMMDRFDFFCFQFGKKLTYLIHQELLDRISRIKGPKDYKKRLIIAEIRDPNGRSWWAIVAKGKTLSQREYDPKQSILTVVPRYDLDVENPIEDILVSHGPWTPETLPFVPSLRQAAVVIKRATLKDADTVKKKNLFEMDAISEKMDASDIEFETRLKVYEKLKVVPDLEIEAMRLEFGAGTTAQPHWRPAIKWGERIGLTMIENDKDFIRILTDPTYKGYKVRQHAKDFLTPSELKALEKFQNKVRLQLG